MGFFDGITDIFSGGGADAAKSAAKIQKRATEEAIRSTRDYTGRAVRAVQAAQPDAERAIYGGADRGISALQRAYGAIRGVQTPFLNEGYTALDGIGRLASSGDAQRAAVLDSPFYGALAEDATNRLYSNQAARGKLGSGETAKALQTNLLTLGSDLLDREINRRLSVGAVGERAAGALSGAASNLGAGTASIETGAGTQAGALRAAKGNTIASLLTGESGQLADLITGAGNAQAAGKVGAANANAGGFGNLVNTALGIGSLYTLSDVRAKEDIRPIGKTHDGINLYVYRYKGRPEPHVGVLAQEAERVRPDAVGETIEGIKGVDYVRLAS